MGKRSRAKRRWSSRPVLQLVLVLEAGCFVSAKAVTARQDSGGVAPAPEVSRNHNLPVFEQRVRSLSQALALDAMQQSELRKVLEEQREQLRKIWSDATAAAANRVSATQALSDLTADRIMALLNDEQKKKYKSPRPLHEAAAGSKSSVEDWMNTRPNWARF